MIRFLLLVALTSSAALAADESDYDAASYAICSACHQQDGTGIPGAFPPVRSRAAVMAGLEGGREYLISVVSYGLMGSIDVDGQTYFGVMPGNTGMLQPEAIATSLNYLVFELTDDADSLVDLSPFTSEEVSAFQDSQESADFNTTAALRAALIEKHGDAWPG